MPSLIAKQKEKAVVTKLKKFYSSFSQAYQMAINENGTIDNWGLVDKTFWYDENGAAHITDESKASAQEFINIILPYYVSSKYNKHMDSYTLPDGISIVQPDLGISNCIQDNSQHCGRFRVDLKNADKNNNQSFLFDIYKDKVVPFGTYMDRWFSNNKDMVDETFRRDYGGNHVHCTAWVIYNENMDYLHCPNDLSWYGAKTCKEAQKNK